MSEHGGIGANFGLIVTFSRVQSWRRWTSQRVYETQEHMSNRNLWEIGMKFTSENGRGWGNWLGILFLFSAFAMATQVRAACLVEGDVELNFTSCLQFETSTDTTITYKYNDQKFHTNQYFQFAVSGNQTADVEISNIEYSLDNISYLPYAASLTAVGNSTAKTGGAILDPSPLYNVSLTVYMRLTIPAGAAYPAWNDPEDPGYFRATALTNSNNSQTTGGLLRQFGANNFLEANTETSNPVSLAWFKSRREGQTAVIDFATETETNNLGFELYVQRNSGLIKLGGFIPSKAVNSATPLFYRTRVPYLEGDSQYVLRDIDIDDQSTDHGPFPLWRAEGAKPKVQPVGWKRKLVEMRARERLRQNLARSANRRAAVAGLSAAQAVDNGISELLTIRVSQAGVQRITDADIRSLGVNLSGTNIRRLQLLDAAGRTVPVRYEGLISTYIWNSKSSLSFVGEARESTVYLNENVYRLRRGGKVLSTPMAGFKATPPAKGAAASSFLATARVAQQKVYDPIAPNGDPWYQQAFVWRANPYTVPFSLEGLVANAPVGAVTVDVWGGINAKHHVFAKVNGGAEHEAVFDGVTAHALSLDASQLQDGVNTLSLRVPGDLSSSGKDLINLEGLTVSYPRRFVAGATGLSFSAAGAKFEVSGLSSPQTEVYRVASNGAVNYLTDLKFVKVADGSFTLGLKGDSNQAYTYHVVTAAGLVKPRLKPAVQGEGCADQDVDYLAVVHPQFDTPLLEGLLARREAQGFKVGKISTEALYARYSGGLVDPGAIEACVKEAAGLKQLLLVGSDTYDPNNYLGLGSLSFVPTRYIAGSSYTKYVPCDSCFGFVDGELKVVVGRLPARDNQELARLLTQIQSYESRIHARKLLQVADVYDAKQKVDFKAIAQSFGDQMPAGWQVQSIFLDEYANGAGFDVASAKANIKAGIEAGAALTSYVGHSAPGRWSFQNLFTLADVLALDVKGQPTLVTQWGCWNTYFVEPKYNTMAHGFLLGGGKPGAAAAVLGASTLSSVNEQRRLGQNLALTLSQPGITLGEAVLKAKQATGSGLQIAKIWNLLGDPGLIIDK